MLEVYKKQQDIQGILATFLDFYPSKDPHKEALIALTNFQLERLKFLIGELETPFPSHPRDISTKVWKDYYKSYSDQQLWLGPIATLESVAVLLPNIVLPKVQMEEDQELLEQGTVGFQSEDSASPNKGLSESRATFFSQQPPVPAITDSSITQGRLGEPSAHSFFSLPEKTGKNSKAGIDKYALYEERVQSLKERKSSLSKEEKVELKRLSNAISAHHSRAKKKEHAQLLEVSLEENKAKNKELKKTCFSLMTEQRMLKELRLKLMDTVTKLGVDPNSLLNHAMTQPAEMEEPVRGESFRFG